MRDTLKGLGQKTRPREDSLAFSFSCEKEKYRIDQCLHWSMNSTDVLFVHDSNPLFVRKTAAPMGRHEKTKSEPGVAGPILKGRRRRQIRSFRGVYANRGNGVQSASSDAGTHERIRMHRSPCVGWRTIKEFTSVRTGPCTAPCAVRT